MKKILVLALILGITAGFFVGIDTQNAQADGDLRLAAIFPGVITDADYNTLGYEGIEKVKEVHGIETAYSEAVPVPDVDRVMREYIDLGYNIIWSHGAQFLSQTLELAPQFPDVVFVCEGDNPIEDAPENFWMIDRKYHNGFYALGVLAALQTETNKIGFVSGLTLPFTYAEAHSIEAAIEDLGLTEEIEFKPVWTGNFNDPTAARQVADALISEDVDVIIGGVNLGMFGIFEALKATDSTVFVTGKYTDKSAFFTEEDTNYMSAMIYNFADPMVEIVGNIMEGEMGGYYPLTYENGGISIQLPIQNTTDEINEQVTAVVEQIKNGELIVEQNTEPIEVE